jgi:SNF2 family DNA or RNA helicase
MSAILPLMILQRQISSSTSATQNALRKKRQRLSGYESDIDELIEISEKIKIDTKMKLLQEIIQKNQHTKYLIFTEFIDTQDYIAESLENSGTQVTKFNGSMPTTERDMSVSKFKRDIPVMISTEAGGEGQNFQFCSNVINYDLPWNPMRVEQRVGRVHRIGQTEDVRIHNFAIKDTIEEYVLQLLYEKINLFRMTIGDLDLLFGDEGMENLPNQIFDSYMSSKSRNVLKNKFSALGEYWTREQKTLNDAILEFDDQVFANFNLSALKDLK